MVNEIIRKKNIFVNMWILSDKDKISIGESERFTGFESYDNIYTGDSTVFTVKTNILTMSDD